MEFIAFYLDVTGPNHIQGDLVGCFNVYFCMRQLYEEHTYWLVYTFRWDDLVCKEVLDRDNIGTRTSTWRGSLIFKCDRGSEKRKCTEISSLEKMDCLNIFNQYGVWICCLSGCQVKNIIHNTMWRIKTIHCKFHKGLVICSDHIQE